MFYNEQYEKIIEILKSRNSASVHFLSAELNVSEPTVRRYLSRLEKENRVKRTFGGAVLNSMATSEIPLSLRESEESKVKDFLAKKASEFIKDGYVIFLDASSTAAKIIKYLPRFKDLTVITNSPKNALSLAELKIKTYCTGGLLLDSSIAFVGSAAEKFVSGFHADIFFFSCRGVSADGVLSDSSVEESEIRKVMLKNSDRKIFICASNKINRQYMYTLCAKDDVDEIITDGVISE